jgi:hypothetical protein
MLAVTAASAVTRLSRQLINIANPPFAAKTYTWISLLAFNLHFAR